MVESFLADLIVDDSDGDPAKENMLMVLLHSSLLFDMCHGLTSFALASINADRQHGAHED